MLCFHSLRGSRPYQFPAQKARKLDDIFGRKLGDIFKVRDAVGHEHSPTDGRFVSMAGTPEAPDAHAAATDALAAEKKTTSGDKFQDLGERLLRGSPLPGTQPTYVDSVKNATPSHEAMILANPDHDGIIPQNVGTVDIDFGNHPYAKEMSNLFNGEKRFSGVQVWHGDAPLFHGASAENASAIRRSGGFRPSVKGLYGPGSYFGTHARPDGIAYMYGQYNDANIVPARIPDGTRMAWFYGFKQYRRAVESILGKDAFEADEHAAKGEFTRILQSAGFGGLSIENAPIGNNDDATGGDEPYVIGFSGASIHANGQIDPADTQRHQDPRATAVQAKLQALLDSYFMSGALNEPGGTKRFLEESERIKKEGAQQV